MEVFPPGARIQADPAHQIRETRILPHRIEGGVSADVEQRRIPLVESSLEPVEARLGVAHDGRDLRVLDGGDPAAGLFRLPQEFELELIDGCDSLAFVEIVDGEDSPPLN